MILSPRCWLQLRQLVLFFSLTLLLSYAAFASDWQRKVPDAEISAPNPLAGDPNAATAGAKIYAKKCAKCHGADAEGKGSHPALRGKKMEDATPGDLHWIVTHGTGMRGMPSFKKLADAERWQLVSYIKSLQGTPPPDTK